MKISVEDINSYSDKGVRKNNEDQYGVYLAEDGSAALLVIADGMGGHSCGEVASEWAVNVIVKMFEKYKFDDAEKLLEDSIISAHERIQRDAAGDERKEGMGTTVVAAVLRGKEVLIGHVGDSRAILFRMPYVRRLTRDHLFAIDVLGCDEGQAKRHAQGNVLSQALGVDGTVKPVINRFDVQSGDVIVLCTDGVSECVTELEMGTTIDGQPFDILASGLVQTALANKSRDNCTVVAARIP